MVDIWRNWSEKEKQGFYACIAAEADQKALQTLITQFRKTLGRDSSEKIKNLYYKAIITVKKACDLAGVDLEANVPEAKFFENGNLEIISGSNLTQLKKEVRNLSKNKNLFTVRFM